MPGAMYLHDAIATVLRATGRPMHVSEIAAEIDRQGLYERNDGAPLPQDQIWARVAKHRNRFSVRDGYVRLR
jgi:hypothetical protein